MDIDKIIQLIDKVAQTPVTKLSVEEGSLKINIEKQQGIVSVVTDPAGAVQQTAPQVMMQPVAQTVIRQAETAAGSLTDAPEKENADEGKVITAPIVGVFYEAPGPEAKPFVSVGDTVKKGQVVGIIEAMKLMNEIESEVDGVIAEVLVKNETAVEYGQPLFKVK